MDITDWEAIKLKILSFRGDELDMMTKKCPYWTERCDLVICQVRGNMDITDWEATKLKIVIQRWRTEHDDKEVVLVGLKDDTWLSAGSEVAMM